MKQIMICSILVLALAASVFAASFEGTSVISVSLVNQDPDPAIAGEVVEVRFGVENTGGREVSNLLAELVEEYPFELVFGEDAIQIVGTIDKYQDDEDMKIIKYKLRSNRDATAGSYELKVRYYEEGSDIIKQKSFTLDIKNKESAEVIHIDKTSLVPGEETPLKFTVNNVGNAPLRDMTFSWENEDDIILPVGSDNTRYIKYLDIEESAELEFNVIADTNADPGLYKLDLSLTYEDPITGEDEEIATIAGIYVGGETDFDVAFSESSNGEVSFTVANIGSNEAYSVSIIIHKQEGWSVSGSNTMIIGNLDKGDYTVASFTLSSGGTSGFDRTAMQGKSREEIMKMREESGSTGGSDNVKIQIVYTDTMGKRTTVEKEVQVNLQSATIATGGMSAFNGRTHVQQSGFFSQYKWYIIGAIVLFVLFVGYKKYKKKKMINPNYNLFGKNKKK